MEAMSETIFIISMPGGGSTGRGAPFVRGGRGRHGQNANGSVYRRVDMGTGNVNGKNIYSGWSFDNI